MPGRIQQSDVEQVKARVDILDVVGEYVTLKRAGSDSYKGLSPFKEERTPSFHVRPRMGLYHCFSTGKGGDVYSFVQEMENVTFVEAVERLAGRIGYELHYEESNPQQDEERSRRTRLLAANQAAAEYFQQQLVGADAEQGRSFLAGRGFGREAATHFGIGFAPRSRDALSRALKAKGFTAEELLAAGLTGQGDRGDSYDRFRGRLIWPIRDVTGQTVGFGARKLFDDDKGPKYLNTPETAVFHKSRVLYGLDLARRSIGKQGQVVVVEGYTDVMACHLSGVTTAVATSGTAFGSEHISMIRRVLGDDSLSGEIIFTFDPDAAGQKAALRAFQEERRFIGQTYVAVAPDSLDPCDLRLARGDQAVQQLLVDKRPMFEFVLRQKIAGHDLDSVEGRLAALREAAPVVAGIRDDAIRRGYAQPLARMLGMDPGEVSITIQRASESGARRQGPAGSQQAHTVPGALGDDVAAVQPGDAAPAAGLSSLPSDPLTRLERDALMAVLQDPVSAGAGRIIALAAVRFDNGTLGAIRDAVVSSVEHIEQPGWLTRVVNEVPGPLSTLVKELGMAPLPTRGDSEEALRAYVDGVTAALVERELLRQKTELLGALQRCDANAEPEKYRSIQGELQRIEQERRGLRHD